MSDVVIRVEDLSKQYRLGAIGTKSLVHDVNRWWHRMRGHQDPYLKIGEENDRTKKGSSEYVWALRDINFDIRQGEAVGIIGRNGAGKSTLLKILSRTTTPTTGSVKIKGRIASLLEVGTGFHPELSGRENIFLNGAILGMSKGDIRKKFDEIVDFAGVERYIDTPVKRYSSGMYVRLAFGVAAHLEPDILIVDEVLAVGDAEFQKKCLGKMRDVSVNEGRTVLFVSHNLAAIQNLCNSGIFLSFGKLKTHGAIDQVMNDYVHSGNSETHTMTAVEDEKKEIQILRFSIEDENGQPKLEFSFGQPIFLNFEIKNLSPDRDVRYNVALYDSFDRMISVDAHYVKPNNGYRKFRVSVPSHILTPNKYKVGLAIDIPSVKLIDELKEKFFFEISNKGSGIGARGDKDYGFLVPSFTWEESENVKR